MKFESKELKKPEKSGCQSNAIPSAGKIKIKNPVSSAASSTGGAFTEASSTHGILDVEVDDDGAPTISPRSSSGKDATSNPYLVLSLYVKYRGLLSLSFIVTRAPARMFLFPKWVACSFSFDFLRISFNAVQRCIACRFYRVIFGSRTSKLHSSGSFSIVFYNLLNGAFLFQVLFSIA